MQILPNPAQNICNSYANPLFMLADPSQFACRSYANHMKVLAYLQNVLCKSHANLSNSYAIPIANPKQQSFANPMPNLCKTYANQQIPANPQQILGKTCAKPMHNPKS